MTKFLSGCAAAALLGALSLSTPAVAFEQKADGFRNTELGASDMSSRRKKRVVIRRYYDDEPSYSYRTYRTHRTYRSWDDDGPYHGYGYRRGPGVSVGVGGMGVHVDRW